MKLLSRMKKQVAIGMVAAMALSMSVTTMASDYTNHWAEDVITEWTGYGVIGGYEDGSFKPNNSMTRAEFAVILTNIFGLEKTSDDLTFSDVTANAWYYAPINKVTTAGMMKGANGKFNPNATITRQEVAVALVNAYHLALVEGKTVTFTDADTIAAWAKDAVEILASHGYISGRADGKVDPTANITRAEVIKMIDNIVTVYINKPGTYTVANAGNVVVASEGVVLKDMTVSGNVYLAQGVEAADVTLEKSTVTGSSYDVSGQKVTLPIAAVPETAKTDTNNGGGSSSSSGSSDSGSSVESYIKISSVKVDDEELLGKGISVNGSQIDINIDKLVANHSASSIYGATAKVSNLKAGTKVKITAQIGSTSIAQSREISEAGELNYTVRDGSSLLSGKYNAIAGTLKDLGLLDACEDVAQKVGYSSLKDLLATRDSLNEAELENALNKLVELYNADDENTMKVVDYLNSKGMKITSSSFSYAVKVEADKLETKEYTINVTF